ncbi:hypothetical protein KBY65_00625 [Cyanobium sp. Alchichica 3B3-8F6]|nr:hypothetical protein [Cyanobium sp. Alchichica 3B3-8F6]
MVDSARLTCFLPFFFFIFLDSSFNFGDGISRALEAASEPISELVSDALSVSFSLAMDQHTHCKSPIAKLKLPKQRSLPSGKTHTFLHRP